MRVEIEKFVDSKCSQLSAFEDEEVYMPVLLSLVSVVLLVVNVAVVAEVLTIMSKGASLMLTIFATIIACWWAYACYGVVTNQFGFAAGGDTTLLLTQIASILPWLGVVMYCNLRQKYPPA